MAERDVPHYNEASVVPFRPRHLKGGDGGGTFDAMMEARVARIEDDMKEIRADLKAIRIDVAEMKGRVASLPTTWQLITLVFGILGGAFLILKFGFPHVSG